MSPRYAFTLIELLIVVAIIAILAAIAVPNFLEAQVRAKVSRAKADLRTLATALEAYATDWNLYPPCNAFGVPGNRSPVEPEPHLYLERLSTPVAHITDAFPRDPFQPTQRITVAEHADLPGLPAIENDNPRGPQWRSYTYTSWNPEGRTTVSGGGFDIESSPRSWVLQSSGPDRHYFNMGGILANFSSPQAQDVVYDATNGTVSYGAIFRVGGEASSGHGAGFFEATRSLE